MGGGESLGQGPGRNPGCREGVQGRARGDLIRTLVLLWSSSPAARRWQTAAGLALLCSPLTAAVCQP
eukprot:3241773-Rhodomonas_salina.2